MWKFHTVTWTFCSLGPFFFFDKKPPTFSRKSHSFLLLLKNAEAGFQCCSGFSLMPVSEALFCYSSKCLFSATVKQPNSVLSELIFLNSNWKKIFRCFSILSLEPLSLLVNCFSFWKLKAKNAVVWGKVFKKIQGLLRGIEFQAHPSMQILMVILKKLNLAL